MEDAYRASRLAGATDIATMITRQTVLRALVGAGIHASSSVAAEIARQLIRSAFNSSGGATTGGRRRKAALAAEAAGVPARDDLDEATLLSQIEAERREISRIQQSVSAMRGMPNWHEQRPLLEQAAKAAWGRLKDLRRRQAHLRDSYTPPAPKAPGPGSKEWRRFARDFRRQSRFRRYTSQSPKNRFMSRYKSKYR